MSTHEEASVFRPPVTMGRKYGLGRNLPTPREHCKRCAEILERADQIVMNYILANGRQVAIINRLMKDDHDGAAEIVTLGQLLAEKDGLITAIYSRIGYYSDDALKALIDEYNEEVNSGGPDGRAASPTQKGSEGAAGA